MIGKLLHYRQGRKTQYKYQMIIQVDSIDDKAKAETLLGKTVTFTTESGKEINGEVTRVHGAKGKVIARFERGLPGQALNQEVTFK